RYSPAVHSFDSGHRNSSRQSVLLSRTHGPTAISLFLAAGMQFAGENRGSAHGLDGRGGVVRARLPGGDRVVCTAVRTRRCGEFAAAGAHRDFAHVRSGIGYRADGAVVVPASDGHEDRGVSDHAVLERTGIWVRFDGA